MSHTVSSLTRNDSFFFRKDRINAYAYRTELRLYYLKYMNRRADYVDAWWNVVDWNKVANQFNAELARANVK